MHHCVMLLTMYHCGCRMWGMRCSLFRSTWFHTQIAGCLWYSAGHWLDIVSVSHLFCNYVDRLCVVESEFVYWYWCENILNDVYINLFYVSCSNDVFGKFVWDSIGTRTWSHKSITNTKLNYSPWDAGWWVWLYIPLMTLWHWSTSVCWYCTPAVEFC